MRKVTASIIFLLALCVSDALMAQDVFEVKRIETDSLVTLLRKGFGQKIYYIHNERDENTYTIAAKRGDFVSAALQQLRQPALPQVLPVRPGYPHGILPLPFRRPAQRISLFRRVHAMYGRSSSTSSGVSSLNCSCVSPSWRPNTPASIRL